MINKKKKKKKKKKYKKNKKKIKEKKTVTMHRKIIQNKVRFRRLMRKKNSH